MISRAISWFSTRFQPESGWLAVILMGVITLMVAYQVTATRWVPEGSIASITIISLILTLILIQRRVGLLPAWLLLIGYGIVLTTLWLGRLWPPIAIILDGWGPVSAHIRQNWFLFSDRAGGWLEAVSEGSSSHETIVFAFGLGLIAWLLVAIAAWITFRQRRPVTGLVVLGLALAFNGFYGRAPLLTVPIFTGLAILLIAAVHLSTMQQRWELRGIDYSTEIRIDLLINGAAVALLLMALGFLVPEFNLQAMYRVVFDRPAIHQIEEGLEKAFAGVQVAGDVGTVSGTGESQSAGRLPRSFLLGGAPELYETIVMTATVLDDISPGSHWRGVSYDIYTGQGWTISAERRELIPAGEIISMPDFGDRLQVRQVINRPRDNRSIRYSLGQPLLYGQDVEAYWRGVADLSRIVGQGMQYEVVSQIAAVGLEQLRRANLADIPPGIMARYTALPDSVPERVHELAVEIATGAEASDNLRLSVYDTTKRIEAFLRQYTYSLDVDLPPAGVDPVDFFLFDQQRGYCDYYASAMVVLARSLGIPARLETGYLAQPADQNGRQFIYQINAHSWAEVYFAGYGWVEFEPTAGFSTHSAPAGNLSPTTANEQPAAEYVPPPIPIRQRSWDILWWLLLPVTLVIGGWLLWRRRTRKGTRLDEAQWVYGHLLRGARRLGQPTPANQTPLEFESALLDQLEALEEKSLSRRLEPVRMKPQIQQLTSAFTSRQYSQDKRSPGAAVENWQRIRLRFGLLGLINRLFHRW